jgi:phosphoribosylformylglycinamidine synthase
MPQHLDVVTEHRLAPLRYVDDSGACTEQYPLNPNGSPQGMAALCSDNGRHLAIMPHPERSFLKWQVKYCYCSAHHQW